MTRRIPRQALEKFVKPCYFNALRDSLTLAGAVASTLLAAAPAFAQEGARSVGHGIKCRQSMVKQADGTYRVQQVCYKSV